MLQKMGTKILSDIYNDLKLLIKSITKFEENDEGFKICERYVVSNIKHHRYLSVDSHATKELIDRVVQKFIIHGKYDVAETFKRLIYSFLQNFDFANHPQYDLQWTLLTVLLDLSTETSNANLNCLKLSKEDFLVNPISNKNETVTDEIDWAKYLKADQEAFFSDFHSDNESVWSNSSEEEINLSNDNKKNETSLQLVPTTPVKSVSNYAVTLSEKLSWLYNEEQRSKNWVIKNIQHTWWNELEWHKCSVSSNLLDANFCELWQKISTNIKSISTFSEYEISRELLWMFHVQTSMLVFQETSCSFSIASNVSVPSLSVVSFNSIIQPFCAYFKMLHSINQFSAELHPKYNKKQLSQQPPLTYEAYNTALKRLIFKFRYKLIEIERRIMRQDDSNTLLSLSQLLRKYLNYIKILHDIHTKIVINWGIYPNWKCASSLLSNLYFEMQNSYSRERSNLCAYLYISSFTVYLNIIDTWLTEGRLEDWRDEFIIARIFEDESENTGRSKRFKVRYLDNICLKDPIMQSLIHRVKNMGNSIELLVSLDRISDLWKNTMTESYNDTNISLNSEFNKSLKTELLKYSFTQLEDQIDSISIKTSGQFAKENDVTLERNIVEQLLILDNPFLTKALERYIPIDLQRKDTVDSDNTNTNNPHADEDDTLFEMLEKISQFILPLRKLFENVLLKVLDSRYNSASKIVKSILTQEYKLEAHMKLMRSVYMMEAGHIMNKFNNLLFYEIESNQMWNNSYFLSCMLEEVLSQQWPDSSSRWSIKVENAHTCQVLQAVNLISLHYTIGWPISLVLNAESLELYNDIFRFQLKIKWAIWTLNNLRFSDLEKSKLKYMGESYEFFYIRRLESLRFWLMHAIGSIHTYLSGQVLQNLGMTLEKTLSETDSLDMIVSVHNEYLAQVHKHCLLTDGFEDLMITVNNIIEMCSHVRDLWCQKKILHASAELNSMESSYTKYHTYLALALHNAVQHKDADYLTGLSSAFNCSMPCI
ncbi:gamma-tubulin complex component 5-like [Prorops nasuta]|uniref:gamma-tubulin complex component 5-like n=1 Tax=Prorops nasuta TaxID=863751 RepID=UPI0034CF8F55